jgi:predicted nuclease of predicted toxin-antitoxin system
MRLLLDENLQTPTVNFLRELGYDAVGVLDENLTSQSDERIFKHARQTERVLLTYNADFVDMRELAGVHHSGIIRLRISNQRLAFVHPILKSALASLQSHDLRDALVTLSDSRVRIRHTFDSSPS